MYQVSWYSIDAPINVMDIGWTTVPGRFCIEQRCCGFALRQPQRAEELSPSVRLGFVRPNSRRIIATSAQTTNTTRAAANRATPTRRARRMRELALGYTLLAQAIVLLALFEFYPILYGLYISSCDWRLRCVNFVGFANYVRALGDRQMWHALWITTVYS